VSTNFLALSSWNDNLWIISLSFISSIVPPGVELDTVPSFSKSDTFSFYNGKYHTVTTDPRLTTISLEKN